MKMPSTVSSVALLVMSLACTPLLAQTPASAPDAAAAKPAAKVEKNAVFAKVNGRPVYQSRVDALTAQLAQQQDQRLQQQRQQQPGRAPAKVYTLEEIEVIARDQVVAHEMLVQEAVRRGLSTTPAYLDQIQVARENILMHALQEQLKTEISQADIKAEFDKVPRPPAEPEVRAHHILVAKEALAKQLIAQIKAGAKFEDLAKKHSTDQGSGQAGGDLDWATPRTYVPEFGKALSALKKGEMTSTPVKTSYGYHIIRVDDIREAPAMDMSGVEPQIREYLVRKRFSALADDLKTRAKTDHKFMPPRAAP